MNGDQPQVTSRRNVLKTAATVAAATALAGPLVPGVHAAGSDLVQLVLVGCGGRGSGATVNALGTNKKGPIKLVAMADAYEHRLKSSYTNLIRSGVKQFIDVPEDRKFIGFDAYRKAMDCLKPGDIAIFATPLAFRWVHFTYAIEKGLNVFMEKPLTADGPTSRRMLDLAKQASAKNLKVGVGLMSRHARHLEDLSKRIQDGAIGDIVLMRGYRMHGPVGYFASLPKPAGISELDYQVQRFHSMLWAGGGCFSDFNIHIIDHLCWMKGSWPVMAQGNGGRHYKVSDRGVPYIDQNFDNYSIEYTFGDGTKLLFDGRCINGAATQYNSAIHGTKGYAIASNDGDCGAPSSIYSGLAPVAANKLWESNDNTNPYDNEWDDLIDAIRNDKPYNEVPRGVQASLVTSMGRRSAHTGQVWTYDQMLNDPVEFAPGLDKLTKDSPAPVHADEKGMYPQPEPGRKKTEY